MSGSHRPLTFVTGRKTSRFKDAEEDAAPSVELSWPVPGTERCASVARAQDTQKSP